MYNDDEVIVMCLRDRTVVVLCTSLKQWEVNDMGYKFCHSSL